MPNRLAAASSPYLRQHADNPVDWHPWGDDAFALAHQQGKPVFLSIGYATCHWCHVMAHESFEDDAVARLLNEAFVCVKVDREERPDVDQVYMAVCQAMTGHGGWPLTLLLTPERQPFFAATYIPKHTRGQRLGLLDWVPRVQALWQQAPERARSAAAGITEQVRAALQTEAADAPLDASVLDRTATQLAQRFDPEFGGFGAQPKFPTPHHLLFLLRHWQRTGDAEALQRVTHTLRAMHHGGLHDHLGGGFHRYSTDRRWLLPHFEKMLYDQALLAMAYTEAWQAMGGPGGGDALFRTTAESIFAYVLRDLTHEHGGFFSAEDADSEHPDGHMEEGAFYVWTEAELDTLLGDDAALAKAAFGTEPAGNFEDEATHQKTGANVLHRPRALDTLAAEFGAAFDTAEADIAARLDAIQATLFAHRNATRKRPLRDEKVLTDWNGLLIAALARAARAFDRPDYAAAASRAADFVLTTLRTDDGLLHRWHDAFPLPDGTTALAEAGIPANLDDYAFLVFGLTDLYQATFDPRWLREALALHNEMDARFADPQGDGYFFTAAGGEHLLTRVKEFYDGAIPSGNSVAMLNALRLARLTGRTDLEATAARIGQANADVAQAPIAHTFLMCAADWLLGSDARVGDASVGDARVEDVNSGAQEVVIAGDPDAADAQALLRVLNAAYVPNAVAVLRPAGDAEALTDLVPYAAAMTPVDGPGGPQAAAYVCEGFACQAPVTTPEALRALLA
ncbi:MAG: thioredoxin domain-containing protein [Bacteroidota bacterium]